MGSTACVSGLEPHRAALRCSRPGDIHSIRMTRPQAAGELLAVQVVENALREHLKPVVKQAGPVSPPEPPAVAT